LVAEGGWPKGEREGLSGGGDLHETHQAAWVRTSDRGRGWVGQLVCGSGSWYNSLKVDRLMQALFPGTSGFPAWQIHLAVRLESL